MLTLDVYDRLAQLVAQQQEREIMQELENYAASKKGVTVWRMQPWFCTANTLWGNEGFAHLVAELLSIGAATGLKPGVADLVVRLDALISEGRVPPIAILRHPRVRLSNLLRY